MGLEAGFLGERLGVPRGVPASCLRDESAGVGASALGGLFDPEGLDPDSGSMELMKAQGLVGFSFASLCSALSMKPTTSCSSK